MISPQDAYLITTSFNDAVARDPALCARFYDGLFERAPEARAMFPEDMAAQTDKLAAALSYVVQGLLEPGRIAEPLREMGRRHDAYGAAPAHYALVGETLIATLAGALDDDWSEDHQAAWSAAYDLVSKLMLREA